MRLRVSLPPPRIRPEPLEEPKKAVMTHPTPATRLIDAMLADGDFLDRVAEFHPTTIKFQRVLNSEEAARELRLADVARMIDLPIAALVTIADGGEPEDATITADEPLAPGWLEPGPNAAVLDLRPVFEAGFEPLMLILEEVSNLAADDVLVLEAPFHPLPLRRLLRGRGFESFAREVRDGSWQIALRRTEARPA